MIVFCLVFSQSRAQAGTAPAVHAALEQLADPDAHLAASMLPFAVGA